MMTNALVQTRETGQGTEYYYPICQCWVKGKIWDGRGVSIRICDGFDLELDTDPFGLADDQ